MNHWELVECPALDLQVLFFPSYAPLLLPFLLVVGVAVSFPCPGPMLELQLEVTISDTPLPLHWRYFCGLFVPRLDDVQDELQHTDCFWGTTHLHSFSILTDFAGMHVGALVFLLIVLLFLLSMHRFCSFGCSLENRCLGPTLSCWPMAALQLVRSCSGHSLATVLLLHLWDAFTTSWWCLWVVVDVVVLFLDVAATRCWCCPLMLLK